MSRASILAVAFLLAAVPAQARLPAVDWGRYSVLTAAGPQRPDPDVMKRLKPLVYATHEIQKGEYNMYALAQRYGTTMTSLQATNANELILLSPGMKISVHNKKGLLYTVRKESESLDDILRRYRREQKAFDELKKKVVETNGLPGIALLERYELREGDRLLLPDITIEFDTYRFPFLDSGWHRISSNFGSRMHPILKRRRFHEGLDLPKPFGTPVYAARNGRVTKAGWMEGYGNMVEVRHTDGASSRYGHLSKVTVTEGQWVVRGKTLLGRVGSSGLSTGPHLHFEVRDSKGRALNPRAKIGRK